MRVIMFEVLGFLLGEDLAAAQASARVCASNERERLRDSGVFGGIA